MRPRVLVVDDDFSVAMLHRRFVEDHGGFEVVGVAHTGEDALHLVATTAPDLVLLDVFLPDLSGIEVLRRIRAMEGAAHVDVIAITAARELDTVRAAMAGGVLHYLVKPFTAATLRERLGDYLRHHEQVRRSASAATLDQDAVDRLLAQPRSAGALPKGLSRRTLDLVASALDELHGDASASEVAGIVGISRVSARRYLEHLVARGQADVVPRYGGAGRPENRYRSASASPRP
jgi:two-component system CitB family response regulator